MQAVHFGAGNIGRGFIGYVLHSNGFKVNYVDTNENIINQLNENHQYQIELLDTSMTRITVDNVSAYNSLKEQQTVIDLILNATIITTSVGAKNLKRIAPLLKLGLMERCKQKKSINILANENIVNASSLLKKEIYALLNDTEKKQIDQYCFFVNTAIDRQSLSKAEDGEQIAVVEPYYEWVIDENQLDPNTSFNLNNVRFVDDMQPYIERKLFLVNASHAAYAYVGSLFGYHTVQEAIKDKHINALVKKFVDENKVYFEKKYNMSMTDLNEFTEKTAARQSNPRLADDVNRVGREPLRKLNKNDRLVGPVLKLSELGSSTNAGEMVIAAAYLFDNSDDQDSVEMQGLIRDIGIEKAIEKISDVPIDLAKQIAKNYTLLKSNHEQALEAVI